MSISLNKNPEFKRIISHFNLKKIKDGVGHDNKGLWCDLCVKSKVIMHFSDDGFGGDSEHNFTSDVNEKYLTDFAKKNNLAQMLFDNGYGFRDAVEKVSLSDVYDEIVSVLYNIKISEKAEKLILKRCEANFVYGKNINSYAFSGYKGVKSLSQMSNVKGGSSRLQEHYNEIVQSLKSGEKIFNSDEQLISLGIKIKNKTNIIQLSTQYLQSTQLIASSYQINR